MQRTAMQRRLIVVTGSSPGAGKSTVSTALARQLTRQAHPCRLLSEDALLRMDGFARFDWELGMNDPHAIDALLAAARSLVAEMAGSEGTWITDALLPGFFWLLGRYPAEQVEYFSNDLARVLSPVQPLLVYLDADIATAFARTVLERGADWPERMAQAVRRWNLPYYPETPLQGTEDVVRFLEWLRERTLELLSCWRVVVCVLEATKTPVERLARDLLLSIRLAKSDSVAPASVWRPA